MRLAGGRELGESRSKVRTSYRRGSELVLGDVIDAFGTEGFQIVRWGEYDSPLIPITGPGRIGYNHRGDGMAIYDNHPMRIRVFR